jgi:hypothetical protein
MPGPKWNGGSGGQIGEKRIDLEYPLKSENQTWNNQIADNSFRQPNRPELRASEPEK